MKRMMDSGNPLVHRIGHYLAYLWQYRFIYTTTVVNDFKGRFRYTALGYLWHVLNPLTQIVIYYLIFTVIFGRDIPNYWIYVSTGMFTFNFILQSVIGGCGCIVSNSRMVTKMAFAREMLVASKVTTNFITLAISYAILSFLVLASGAGLDWRIVYMIPISLCLAVFCLGLAFFFSAVTVYVRDVANAMGILMSCMMFALPIFYMAGQRSTPGMELFWSINPMYYFVESVHDVFYSGVSPDMTTVLVILIISPVAFAVGLLVFKKLEHGFAERL